MGGRKKRHRTGRVTPPGTPPREARSGSARHRRSEPGLIDDVAKAMAEEHPFSLLALASTLLTVVDPRTHDPFERPADQARRLRRDDLVSSMLDVDLRETTALLVCFAALTSDDVLAARIRRVLASRQHALPAWLGDLRNVGVYRAVEMVHVLGDGDNIMLGLRFPTSHEMTVVVYIDHNLGTVAKDGFVIPEPLAAVVELMRETSEDDPDTAWNDLEGKDARARIEEAIEVGAMTVPRFETETWPACRPLVEWATRLLPPGGKGYLRPEWDDEGRDALAGQFLASPFAAGLDEDQEELLDDLLWFGTDYGPGDPLRWSPVAVELLLLDWVPRKLVDEPSYLSKVPQLLRAFIRFCHAERGIRPVLTQETLAAVDRFEPEYQRLIRSPRYQGPEALLASVGLLDEEPPDYRELALESLRRAVGGEAALAQLDDRPLPDEAFRWDGIPADVHDVVREILALTDRCCAELLNQEYRTACRRFLAAAASGDPAVFRRRARADTAAAAVCWVIGKANGLFSQSAGGMLVKDLMAHFGLKQGGVSQRATALLRAGGFPDHRWGMELGSPAYLVSARRRTIIERRDRFQTLLAEGKLFWGE